MSYVSLITAILYIMVCRIMFYGNYNYEQTCTAYNGPITQGENHTFSH